MVDIKSLDWDELVALQDQINHEMKVREQEKFQKLAQNAADALNALKDAYPYISLFVSSEDVAYDAVDCCGDFEVNVFDCFDHFTAKDFIR